MSAEARNLWKRMPSPMPNFEFDSAKDIQANLEAFYVHMSTIDSECAAMLRVAVSMLRPLPPSGNARTEARIRAHDEVKLLLEALAEANP